VCLLHLEKAEEDGGVNAVGQRPRTHAPEQAGRATLQRLYVPSDVSDKR